MAEMAEQQKLKDVIAANPKVDENNLNKGLAILRELRRIGVTGAEYNINSPFRGRSLKSDEQQDTKTSPVRLRR